MTKPRFRANFLFLLLALLLSQVSMLLAKDLEPVWLFERSIEGYGMGPSLRGIIIMDDGEIFSYRNDGYWDAWSNKLRSLSPRGVNTIDEFTLPPLGSSSGNASFPKPAPGAVELTPEELQEKIGTDVVSLGKLKDKDWKEIRLAIPRAIRDEIPPRHTDAMDALDTTYRVYLPATNSSRLRVIPLAIQQGIEEDCIRPGQACRAIRDWLDDLARRYQRDTR